MVGIVAQPDCNVAEAGGVLLFEMTHTIEATSTVEWTGTVEMMSSTGEPRAAPSLTAGDCSDADLLAAIAERRPGSFEALVERYQNRLFGLAWRVTANTQDSEEAAQDALVRAHRALYGGYSVDRVRALALRPWLFSIVVNTARNRRRRPRPERPISAEFGDSGRSEPADRAEGPAAAAEREELARALERALGELPPKYRLAVALRWIEGLSYEEAALALGRPATTVRSDVHRGLRRLRRQLAGLLE